MTGHAFPIAACALLLATWAEGTAAAPTVTACVDFGCKHRQDVTLDDGDWRAIARLFRSVDSPAAERDAVARAIARLETDVGKHTPTGQDLAENWQRAGEPGELDCIAESRNTTGYLQLLQGAGLLRFHRIRDRVMRGIFFVHWTAVLEEIDNGSRWAVDSWFRDNGRPPVILPLAQWYHYSGPDN